MTYQRGEIDMLLRKVGHNLHDPLSMIIHLADMIGIDTEEQTSEETKIMRSGFAPQPMICWIVWISSWNWCLSKVFLIHAHLWM